MIHTEQAEGVTTIIIDRAERRNSLSYEMIRDLGAAVAGAGADESCRCVVIKGAGKHFCAGRELTTGLERNLAAVLEYDEAYSAIFHTLLTLEKPSVSMVQGYAVAGGFTLAMGCDFVLADETARFGAMEMKNGFPAAVNTAFLSHLAPPRLALELLLFGDPVPARTLYERGLLSRLAPDTKSLERVGQEFVAALAALDPVAVKLAKEACRTARNMPLEQALTYGKTLNALLLASGKIEEGAKAFAARRRRHPS